ncbi:MAG: hypothetical protein IPN34_15025 [Planctomycetes bacterium]|nr:hypothetical protein [Planctomycetota bacterium]
MLGRYTIQRGVPLDALPRDIREGVRQDTRKHTRHCLRPDAALVGPLLATPPESPARDAASRVFARAYRETLRQRFAIDRAPFDALADLARTRSVYLGCNCPTAKNPNVQHCHTALALEFLAEHFPDLRIVHP